MILFFYENIRFWPFVYYVVMAYILNIVDIML